MPRAYALSFDKTYKEIEKQLISQGVGFSPCGTMEIGSTKSLLQDPNILNNPYIQSNIAHPFSDIWYSPDKKTIIVKIYNLDSKKLKGMYGPTFAREMARVLNVLREKLPEVDLNLVGRVDWDKTEELSPKERKYFEEAKKIAEELYRTGTA